MHFILKLQKSLYPDFKLLQIIYNLLQVHVKGSELPRIAVDSILMVVI